MTEKKAQEMLSRRYEKQNEHIRENYDRVSVALPKGTKERIKAAGETINGLVNRLLLAYLDGFEDGKRGTDPGEIRQRTANETQQPTTSDGITTNLKAVSSLEELQNALDIAKRENEARKGSERAQIINDLEEDPRALVPDREESPDSGQPLDVLAEAQARWRSSSSYFQHVEELEEVPEDQGDEK